MGFFSKRRDNLIEQELKLLVASGRKEGKATHIHFDAARRYAQDHGGTLWDDIGDSISFDAEIGNQKYRIMFMEVSPGGGTDITLMPPVAVETTFFGEKSAMHQLVQNSLSEAAPVIGLPLPLSDAKFFFNRFGYEVGASWISDQRCHSGAGIVDLPQAGKCFLLATVAVDRTVVAAQQVPHIEINPENRAEWFGQLTSSVRDWHDNVSLGVAAAD